jgi:hypothetical protein
LIKGFWRPTDQKPLINSDQVNREVRSGQRVLAAGVSQLVQFQIDGDTLFSAHLGQFRFQFDDSATKSRHFERERLL